MKWIIGLLLMALVLDAQTKEAFLSLDKEVRKEIELQILALDKIYDAEIKKLMNDVNIYVAQRPGLSKKRIVADLEKDLSGMTGIFANFKKAIVSDTKAVNYTISEDVFFKGIADETTYNIKKDLLMWQAVFVNTCKDCIALHGHTKTSAGWEGIRPREGATVCGTNCNCSLIPVEVMPDLAEMRKPIKIQSAKIRRAEKKRGKRYAASTKRAFLGEINNPKGTISDLRKIKKIKGA